MNGRMTGKLRAKVRRPPWRPRCWPWGSRRGAAGACSPGQAAALTPQAPRRRLKAHPKCGSGAAAESEGNADMLWKHCLLCRDCLERERTFIYSCYPFRPSKDRPTQPRHHRPDRQLDQVSSATRSCSTPTTACTGPLDRKCVTTFKGAFPVMKQLRPEVQWVHSARRFVEGNI
jgi:hypothetical protein